MPAHILALGTATPPIRICQKAIAETFQRALELEPQHAASLHSIFSRSKIATRHSVIADYTHPELKGAFFGDAFPATAPSTRKRNELYRKAAPKLAVEAAEIALRNWSGERAKISHVISVSCTGMYAPGIEFSLIEALQLPASVERLAINFMGCFGAFKGLAIAKSLARENPKHRILLVCTEFCSLHFQGDHSTETFVANSLFADGAGAAIVGCEPAGQEHSLFAMIGGASLAFANSADLMTWEAGDLGMVMGLSKKVPQLVVENANAFVQSLLGAAASYETCDWAVHPGGKAILQAVEKACGLSAGKLQTSWDILSNYGNMSSATFLFVLEALQRRLSPHKLTVGLGFGPGICFEGILLRNSRA